MSGVYVSGRDVVLKGLTERIRQIKGRTEAGLWQAGLLVKRESLKITPVDTGHLRNSCYLTVQRVAGQPVAEIGYTASYAVYVHEISPKGHPDTGPAGRHAEHKAPTQWKFLETAMKDNAKRIVQIIEKEVRL